jgi:hypothetical protein
MLRDLNHAIRQGTVTVDATVVQAMSSIGVDEPPLASGVSAS